MRQPPKVPRPTPVPRVRSALVDRLGAEDVDGFWDGLGSTPVVEEAGDGHSVVTFLWRDSEAQQVLLFANRLTDETRLEDTLMEQLPGTDLWHVSFLMRSDWRASYAFVVRAPGEEAPWLAADDQVALRIALDRGRHDPRNPDTCRNAVGVLQSVVSLPAAPPQPWLAPRAGVVRGRLGRLRGPRDREVWLHDPADVGDDVPLPVLVVLDGEVWLEHHALPTTLDNLLADRAVEACRTVFLSSGGREVRWAEHADGLAAVDYLVQELLPWVAEQRGVRRGPEHVTVAGQSLGGLTALRAGLLHPDRVGNVVSHSASLWQDDLAGVVGPGTDLHVHLAHGSQEWVLAEPHRLLARRLRAAGVEVDAVEHNGGHDYAWWRGGIADGLVWLAGVRSPRPAPA